MKSRTWKPASMVDLFSSDEKELAGKFEPPSIKYDA